MGHRTVLAPASASAHVRAPSPGFAPGGVSIGFMLFVLDLFCKLCSHGAVPPAEGVLMRRMRTGRDAAPAGSASSVEPPGASGDTARPNYVGPSGNGLVGADERGGKPAESRAFRMAAPV